MKGLKIFNIVLFSIICAFEVALIVFFALAMNGLFSNNFGDIIVSLFALLPYFILGCGILLGLNIVITITTKFKIKKQMVINLPKAKFDKLCVLLPWLFLVLNGILFVLFFVIAKLK